MTPRPEADNRPAHFALIACATAFLLLASIPLEAAASGEGAMGTAGKLVRDGKCVNRPKTPESFAIYGWLERPMATILKPHIDPEHPCVGLCREMTPDSGCSDWLKDCPSGEYGADPVCRGRPPACEPGENGVPPACVGPLGHCGSGEVGVPPACVPPPGQCPQGKVGVPPACVPNPGACDPDQTGAPPACVQKPGPCSYGYLGYSPACVLGPPTCASGRVGVPPACISPPPMGCPDGQVGGAGVCVSPALCPIGTVGVPPNCFGVPIIIPRLCEPPLTGVWPACVDLTGYGCPAGEVGVPEGCGSCSVSECAMRILFDDNSVIDTGIPTPIPLPSDTQSGGGGPNEWCSGDDADYQDTFCEKAFPWHKLKAIGYFYNDHTRGANHVSANDGEGGVWWYEDWIDGRVSKACTDSGGKHWAGQRVSAGLSEDYYVQPDYGIPDCRTGPARGGWGGGVWFK
ncbi:MAG: hypothetical protein LC623_03015 [Halobacteriales archaeon]|nr:hypothetical protein [Halobacteriales archaeon]